MTTDTKAVARYRAKLSHGLIEVETHPAGAFVVFTDHERVVRELQAGAAATMFRMTDAIAEQQGDARAHFEAWALGECLSLHRYDSGPYSHDRTFSAWIAWQAALAASRAELDALNEAQAVGDGTVSGSLLHWHQRALAAESALAASRAEVEGLKRDAERYRWLTDPHFGQLSISDLFNAWWRSENGHPETINDAIDLAMKQDDAAMEKGNV